MIVQPEVLRPVRWEQQCGGTTEPLPPCAQVDFRKEARHLQEFSAYLDASGMRAVATCPYVYKALSTQRCAVLHHWHSRV